MLDLVSTEITKITRMKQMWVYASVLGIYITMMSVYTAQAVGLFDQFIHLYKFSLSYTGFLLLPFILLSLSSSTISDDYRNEVMKNLTVIPISKQKIIAAKLIAIYIVLSVAMVMIWISVCVIGYVTRFQFSMTWLLIFRYLWLCILTSLVIFLSMLPVTLISVATKGNVVITNLIGSMYIIASFFLTNFMNGIIPLATAPHIIWYGSMEGVEVNSNIALMVISIIFYTIIVLFAMNKILKKQEL
ncbi:ABC transporter permease [Dolosigranulum pigrum]|uniref:ABC transporter permease n=1 Tax=Dolosigranulum pigrum TaxID=29394 RepID=UPI001AD88C29|nr:ABC transporter permease [Dolosigranulum pigrum]QTJ47373.1 ABC transporter permease [Dolosigranulum pigrum]